MPFFYFLLLAIFMFFKDDFFLVIILSTLQHLASFMILEIVMQSSRMATSTDVSRIWYRRVTTSLKLLGTTWSAVPRNHLDSAE